MKLCNGRIIENELVLDSHVVVESRSDINYEDQNLVDEQNHPPISPCGKVTGEQFTVKDQMDCKPTGIVYLITCAEPNCPLQYTGQSVNSVINTKKMFLSCNSMVYFPMV